MAVEPVPANAWTEDQDAFFARMFDLAHGLQETAIVYLGIRLGYYEALAAGETLTPADLAEQTGTHPRYARAWLEQQTITGILAVENPGAEAGARRFSLPPSRHAVLLNRNNPQYMAGGIRMLLSEVVNVAGVIEAFRTGGGIPFDAYGSDMREGLDDFSPARFNLLTETWIPAVPDLYEQSRPAARRGSPKLAVVEAGRASVWSSTSRTCRRTASTSIPNPSGGRGETRQTPVQRIGRASSFRT